MGSYSRSFGVVGFTTQGTRKALTLEANERNRAA